MIVIFLNGNGWGWAKFTPGAKNIDFEWRQYDWIYETPMEVDSETTWFAKNWMVVPT